MTRHIIDTARPQDEEIRGRRFAEIERRQGNPAESRPVQALHRQTRREASDQARAGHFLSIDRGREA